MYDVGFPARIIRTMLVTNRPVSAILVAVSERITPPAYGDQEYTDRPLVKRLQRKHDLTEPDVAILLVVDITTVQRWKTGNIFPRDRNRSALIELLQLDRATIDALLERNQEGSHQRRRRRF